MPAEPSLRAYAELLAGEGVRRGLLGPREVPRLWARHLLNCAVVADPSLGIVPPGASVADVGSGAGLPGLVWAICRPDCRVTLIEPLLRRSTFLEESVAQLGLAERVAVIRGRAEDQGDLQFSVVTARAVAPLVRLLPWTMPLVAPGGRLVALKGAGAEAEVAEAGPAAVAQGVVRLEVVRLGEGIVDPPTTVVLGIRG